LRQSAFQRNLSDPTSQSPDKLGAPQGSPGSLGSLISELLPSELGATVFGD